MKKIFIFCLFALSANLSFSQSSFYYKNGKQKPLTIDKSKVNVFMTNSFQKSSVNNLTTKDFDLKDQPVTQEKWATIDFGSQLNDIEFVQKVNALRNNPNVVGVGYHYKAKGGETVGSSNIFYIKLKNVDDLPLLQQQALAKNAVVLNQVDFDPTWYCLKTNRNSTKTSVELANQFFETGLFAEIDPAFILRFVNATPIVSNIATITESTTTACTNDTQFGQQWGLDNPSNPATDINACQAWAIPGATGAGVRVGVVDTGIKLDHNDLTANMHPQSYDSNSQTQPSRLTPLTLIPPYYVGNVLTYYKANHGTHVAGIIGARGNNNTEISGVAPQCKIIGVSNDLDSASGSINTSISLGRGINWAVSQLADIINCSWYCPNINVMTDSPFDTSLLESAITYALTYGRAGKGAILVFASGNNGQYTSYPSFVDPRIMVVGATNNLGERAPFSDYAVNPYDTFDGIYIINNNIDVMAPGVDIRSLTINDIPPPPVDTEVVAPASPGPGGNIDQRVLSGTSQAAPHVSGTAALIISVNPCATGKQVRDYIESTAQKVRPDLYDYQLEPNRPNGTRHEEMGYGLLDAYAATKMAQEGYKPTYDLYIKDFYTDAGKEPSTNTGFATNSPDIWIRNVDDNIDFHQPAVKKTTPNYIYVRVRNKSCVATPPLTDESSYQMLKVSISLPSASNQDTSPTSRIRNPHSNDNYVLVGNRSIPAIAAGEDVILKFPFNINAIPWDPATGNLVNINIKAEIESNLDPMASPLGVIAYNNTVKNNNIACKNNVQIYYDYLADNGGHYPERVAVNNPFDEAHSFTLELVKEDAETGKAIYDEAEVNIKMDDALYAAWQRGGKIEQNLEQTADMKKQIVENNHVLIDNIQLNPLEETSVTVDFSFLAKEATDKRNFKYHIVQRDLATNEIIGVETYNINKKPRPVFEANAGDDKEKDRNETITISAQQISEPAIYNWYDTDGNLICQGKDLTVANDVAKKYKLEVIATADGFKDYTEVEVKLKPSVLSVIAPNPATENVTIGYKINEGGSAYLMILGGYGTNSASNNYIINPEQGEININLANYSSGFYTVALIVNGQIIDAKTLVKE